MINKTELLSGASQDTPRRERANEPESGFQGIFSALAGTLPMFTTATGNTIADRWNQSNENGLGNNVGSAIPSQNQIAIAQNRTNLRRESGQQVSGNTRDTNENTQPSGVSRSENTPVARNSQTRETTPARDVSRVDAPYQESRNNPSSDSQNNLPENGSETAQTQSSPGQNSESQTNPISNSDEIAQKLKELGLDEEEIRQAMILINKEAETGSNELLKTLTGLQNPANTMPDLSRDISSRQEFISQLNSQENWVQDLLVKAGLSNTDAKNLLDKIKTNVENSLRIREVLNSAARDTEINNLPQTEAVATPATNSADQTDISNHTDTTESAESSADIMARLGLAAHSDKRDQLSDVLSRRIPDAKSRIADIPLASKSADQSVNTLSQIANTQSFDTNAIPQNGISDSEVKPLDAVKITTNTPVQNMTGAPDSSSRAIDGVKQTALPELINRGMIEKPIVNQIIEKFSLRTTGQQNEINIKLDPPDLGTVRINITSVGETLRATLVAENHMVKQAIEGNMNQLRDSMADQGLKVESFTVLVGGNQDHKGQSPQQQNEASPMETQLSSVPKETKVGAPLTTRQSFYSETQSISVFA